MLSCSHGEIMAKTVQINLRIEEEKLKSLKHLAHLLSLEQGKDVLYTDLVREGIDIVLKKFKG